MTIHNFADYIKAGDPSTPIIQLHCLAGSSDEKIRRRVAETNRCTPELLNGLSQDNSPDVRMAVCHNTHTPFVILEFLSSDANPSVRYSLATNPNLPHTLLDKLKDDENPYVAARASKTEMRMQSC